MHKMSWTGFTVVFLLITIFPGAHSAQRVEPELFEAVRAGDGARVESLLEAGAYVDATDGERRTALMMAALAGDETIVQMLLRAGAHPNLRDAHGDTALLLASRQNPAVVRRLIEAGADVNLANNEGITPLIAAAHHDIASVRLLLEAGADVSHRDHTGVSALTVAKADGNTEMVLLLRSLGARETMEERLHEAIRAGDRERVEFFVRQGADVDALDNDSYQTPLMTALEHARLDILSLLLEAGADPTVESTGFHKFGDNAISLAGRLKSPWALRTLIQAGARPQDLDAALVGGCSDENIVRIALDAGANANARGRLGVTPLLCAASEGSLEAVRLLLAAGADPRAVSGEGRTALQEAEAKGHAEVAALLQRAMGQR